MRAIQRHQRLPVELLHRTLSLALAQYVDDLLVGPLAIPSKKSEEEELVRISFLSDTCHLSYGGTYQDTRWPAGPDLITSLLATSYQFRQVTLKVIKAAFGVSVIETGIWTYVEHSACSGI